MSVLHCYLFFFPHSISLHCADGQCVWREVLLLCGVCLFFLGDTLRKKVLVACLADKESRPPDRKLQWEEVIS